MKIIVIFFNVSPNIFYAVALYVCIFKKHALYLIKYIYFAYVRLEIDVNWLHVLNSRVGFKILFYKSLSAD